MTNHFRRIVWFAQLMIDNPYGLSKREIDYAWAASGFSNPNQKYDFKEDGNDATRVSLPRTTMYRYIEKIEEYFNLHIIAIRGCNKWVIDPDDLSGKEDVLFKLSEVLHILSTYDDKSMKSRISYPDPTYGYRKLNDMTVAIKDGKYVECSYIGSGACFTLKPLGLRKYNHEWYVVGEMIVGDTQLYQSSPGAIPLETLDIIKVSDKTFIKPSDFDIDQLYSDFVGNKIDFTIPKEKVIVKTDIPTGRQIDYHVIHHSQTCVDSTDDSMVFEFNLRPTDVFYSELLKYGPGIEIIAPDSARAKMKELLSKAIQNYQ